MDPLPLDLSDGSYDYPLSGEPSLVVRLAVNPCASPVDSPALTLVCTSKISGMIGRYLPTTP
jgi:hypothetical protein